MKWMRVVAAVAIVAAMVSTAWADEFTDCMDRAMKLYKEGNFLGAQKELARAGELLGPKAAAQIPPATVKDLTYTNYEQAFRVSAPSADWRIQALPNKPTPNAMTTLVTMSYGKIEDGQIAIFYVRNLKQALGARFDTIAGNESATLQSLAQGATGFVGNLTDCSKPTVAELKVAGKPAVSSEFTGKREATAMHCRVVQVLAGERLFTGIFIGTDADWAARSTDFDNMVGTMSFDVITPEPVLQPTGKKK